MTSPEDFWKLRADIDQHLVARTEELDRVLLALVAKVHLFFLSVPGTAKTLMVTETVKRLMHARIYKVLMSAYADDSLLFGPMSLAGLRADKRIRASNGYLPWAHVFVADEIWKASGALLEAMLMALNERRWDDDGQQKDLNLWSMFCMANEVPRQEHGELRAVWDRIGLRRIVKPVPDENLIALLTTPQPLPEPTVHLDWQQVTEAHEQAQKVHVHDDVYGALLDVLSDLRPLSVFVSDRRKLDVIGIVKAAAWLRGSDEALPSDLEFLSDYLWDDPDQAPDVERIVLAAVYPDKGKLVGLRQTVGQVRLEYEDAARNARGAARSSTARRLYGKTQDAAREAQELVTNEGLAPDVDRLLRSIDMLAADVLTDLGNTSMRAVPSLRDAALARSL